LTSLYVLDSSAPAAVSGGSGIPTGAECSMPLRRETCKSSQKRREQAPTPMRSDRVAYAGETGKETIIDPL
jgi:hypothetical protein